MKQKNRNLWIGIAAICLSVSLLVGGFLWYASVNGAIKALFEKHGIPFK